MFTFNDENTWLAIVLIVLGLIDIVLKYYLFLHGCAGSVLLCGLSPAAVSRAALYLRCKGFSSRWLLLLRSRGARVHGLSCPAACGVFLDQGLNLCPLHKLVGS